MKYNILLSIINLLQDFENDMSLGLTYSNDIDGFKKWIVVNYEDKENDNEPHWEGKENGRSPESVINTLILHMYRYAKSYSKSAIFGSDFSSQEDFIYLITLNAFGEMSKSDLIKRNIHEKPSGMQIISRLIGQGWVMQTDSVKDKRMKVLKISNKGLRVLENQMDKIREASKIVTGNLTHIEKNQLIQLLQKLNDFHQPIYAKNIEPELLLGEVIKDMKR